MFKCFGGNNNHKKCKHYHAVLYEDLYDVILETIQSLFQEIKNSTIFENLELELFEEVKEDMASKEKSTIFNELSDVKKSISNIRKVHTNEELNSLENMTLLNDLIGR